MALTRSQRFAVLIRDAHQDYARSGTPAAYEELARVVGLARGEQPSTPVAERAREIELKRRLDNDFVSPIEIALHVAIIELGAFIDRAAARASVSDALALTVDDEPTTCEEWTLFAQVRVLSYKTDFMAIKGGVMFAVECDGHDFHERTPDQAIHDRSRDRDLMLIGIPTLRFTGREILRNADRCAAQILAFARQLDERTR